MRADQRDDNGRAINTLVDKTAIVVVDHDLVVETMRGVGRTWRSEIRWYATGCLGAIVVK